MDEKQHKLKFAALMEQLGIVYGKEMDELILRAYWAALKDVPIDSLEASVQAHIATEQWFPKPCELRGNASKSLAIMAWDSVIAAAESVGAYRRVDFEDQTVNATVRYLGGWPAICAMGSREEPHVRKEFLATYAELHKSGICEPQARPLPGIPGYQGRIARISAPVVNGKKLLRKRIECVEPKRIESKLKEQGISVRVKMAKD